jgi:hypothetical protein
MVKRPERLLGMSPEELRLERHKAFDETLGFLRGEHGGELPNGLDTSTGFRADHLAAGHLLAKNGFTVDDLRRASAPKRLLDLVYELHHLAPEIISPGMIEMVGDKDIGGRNILANAAHMREMVGTKDVLHNAVSLLYQFTDPDFWKGGKRTREYLKAYNKYKRAH